MHFIRLGTRFINLERIIDAEICIDEFGERGIMLRYIISNSGASGNLLLTTTVMGEDALALENYLNECGIVLTAAEPEPPAACLDSHSQPVPTILDI